MGNISNLNPYKFVVSTDRELLGDIHFTLQRGNLIIGLFDNTEYKSYSWKNGELIAIGDLVDVRTGSNDLISNLQTVSSIADLLKLEYYWGGKYVLIITIGEEYYILGDATCSIPVFYSTFGGVICSTSEKFIVDAIGASADPYLLSIRESGDVSSAMPNDCTIYKEIKQLLPNHLLCLDDATTTRICNSKTQQEEQTAEQSARKTESFIANICKYYNEKYDVVCPITSGRDSRVVLSFIKKFKPNVKCYTINHNEFTTETQDILVPKELSKVVGFEYVQVKDCVTPKSIENQFNDLLGEGNYSPRTLNIACTINEAFYGKAILNGDIIGQVAKCSLHRDIPLSWASVRYFRCKLHKHSKGARVELQKWMSELKSSEERVNILDLFSIEMRMGRWAGLENIIYNAMGIKYLNIFNSRSIIYEWTKVPRRSRKMSDIHVSLIKLNNSKLLDVPFEANSSWLVGLSKMNGVTYYLSTFIKYYANKILKYRK